MYSKQQIIDKLIEVDWLAQDINQADAILCMSEILKESCIQVGVDESKIKVLGNRVDGNRFQLLPQVNYNNNIVRLLYTGRLQEQKNIHGITAALKLVKEQGFKIDFHICGGIVMNDYLSNVLSVLEYSDWTYHGAVANKKLPELHQNVDMYIGPSFFEGFQIPLIEALSCGKPCIVSDQAPANEIINPQIGMLIDPDNPQSIADGIIQLKLRLNNPIERKLINSACKVHSLNWDFYKVSLNEANTYFSLLNKK